MPNLAARILRFSSSVRVFVTAAGAACDVWVICYTLGNAPFSCLSLLQHHLLRCGLFGGCRCGWLCCRCGLWCCWWCSNGCFQTLHEFLFETICWQSKLCEFLLELLCWCGIIDACSTPRIVILYTIRTATFIFFTSSIVTMVCRLLLETCNAIVRCCDQVSGMWWCTWCCM